MEKSEEQIEKEIDVIYAEIRTAESNGEHDECLKLILRLEDEYREWIDETDVDMWRGLCHYHKSEFDKAVLSLERSLPQMKIFYDEPDCMFLILNALGISHYDLGNEQRSVGYLDQALSLIPRVTKKYANDVAVFWVHVYRGRSLSMLDRHDEALKSFLKGKTILTNSNDFQKDNRSKECLAEVEFEIGRMFYSMGNFESAREHLESVLLEDLPVDFRRSYFSCLGSNYYYEKQYEAGLTAFRKLSELGVPEWSKANVYFEIGFCYFNTSDLTNAKKYFDMCLESETDSPSYHEYARRGLVEVQKAMNS